MALLLHANGRAREVAPADGRTFTLEELQAFVGGYIELVYLRAPGAAVRFVNEDGKRLGLSVNAQATALVGHLLIPGDVIVGDAIVVTRDESGFYDDDDEPARAVQPYIICPRCGAVSYHAADVREWYCGHCRRFHDR